MSKVPSKRRLRKPGKPHADFPLFAHNNGWWCKKVRGKLVYFARWDDPDGALAKWLDQKDALLAGRVPRAQGDSCTIRDLANKFLTNKRALVDAGELTERTFRDYHQSCQRLITQFGKSRLVADLATDDFEALRATLAKTRGPVSLGNEIQRVRVVLKFAHDSGLIASAVRYGQSFKRPSRKILRHARHAKGPRMFSRRELRAILKAADPQLRAMVYLGLNAGLGNSDVGNLPLSALDLNSGWLRYPRPKTGVDRRCPLWPETTKALRAAIAERYTPKQAADAEIVFITKRKVRWAKDSQAAPLSAEMGKLLKRLGIKRPGLNFYALRHTFETVAGDSGDQIATSYIMGHAPAGNDMSATYREKVFNHRLYAVAKHVRRWLYTKPKRNSTKETKAAKSRDRPTLRVHRA